MEDKMFKKAMVLSVLLVLTLGISDCGPTSPTPVVSPTRDVEEIAHDASQGVGDVGKVNKGTKGAPILILEETHVSRAGQIQHAITLVRLHERYGLKNIALEGYLKERPEIKTDWFTDAARGLSPTDKNRIAVRLLQEGEISCAEFIKLVYDDISLHPIETIPEYQVNINDEASIAPMLYLLKIALQSFPPEQMPKLEQLIDEFNRAEQGGDEDEIEKKRKELYDFILSTNDWVQAKVKVLQDPDAILAMSAEQHLTLVKEIVDRATTLSVELEPDEKSAMERYLAFWNGRIAASKTMVIAAGGIADRSDVSIVAMVVGAGHTEGMSTLLKNAGQTFAVVTPLSLKNHEEKGDLTGAMLDRKYERLPVFSRGFTETLLKAFPSPSKKKPEPVLQEGWLQGKVELYTYIEKITGSILGPPAPPGGGKPPYGFSDDAFKGRWIFIDPKRISIEPDTPDGKGRTVIFPVILNYNDPAKRTEVWVKAGRTISSVTADERESVESMLMRALQEVQAEQQASDKVEDEKGRVQITLNTVAAIATNQEEARKVILGVR
jgi:hypothetical protein